MPIFIAVIWLLDPLLGVIALVSAVTLFLFAVISDLATRRRQLALNRGTRDSNTEAQRVLDQAETAVGLGMTSDLLRRWRLKRETVERDGGRAIDITTFFQNLSRFVRLSVQVLILGAGAWLVLEGRITAGAMIAASIILARALSPVERSIGAWRSLIQARAAHANLKALFKDDDASAEAIQLPTPSGHLAAHQVRYATGRGHEAILQQVTFDLSPGTACAVIGPSGSGKSTLCRLLVGLWRPSFGTVRLDGADVASWDQQDLARHVGYLPQQVELFAGTVAQNIARMQEADSEAVIRAAQRADVHQLILQLPDGYETDVGLHGAKLSGGQRQRIGLARALFGDPKVLVLDEPNANLDSAGDTALMKTIEEVKREGCTVVLVAHQKAMLRSVDKVLVLKDGGVSAFGDRDDVLYRMAAENRVVSMPEARTRVAGGPPTTSLDEGPAS
jgi:PrtD family type I secretion system ABC transporter